MRMTDKFKPTNVGMRAPVEFLVVFGHLFVTPLTNVLTYLSATVSFLLLLTLGERKMPCQVTVVTRERNERGGSRSSGRETAQTYELSSPVMSLTLTPELQGSGCLPAGDVHMSQWERIVPHDNYRWNHSWNSKSSLVCLCLPAFTGD